MAISEHVRQRRLKRLALAVASALLVHITVMLSSNWGLALISVPSDEDRVITMSLEHTQSEGLKESTEDFQETVNTPHIGDPQPAASAKKRPPVEAPATVPKAEVTEAENIETPQPTPAETPEPPIEQAAPPQIEQHTIAAAPIPVITRPAENSDISAQTIESIPNSDPTPHPQVIAIDAKKLKNIEKKLQRELRKVNNLDDFPDTIEWRRRGDSYQAKLDYIESVGDMGIDEVRVSVSTEQDGQQLTTTLRLKKLVFSNFAQFVNRWDDNTVIHDDRLDGRFHSNTLINVAHDRKASPVFEGKVTTAAYRINKQGFASSKHIFLGGLETRVKKIAMPKPQSLFAQIQGQTANTLILEEDSRIVFVKEGYLLKQPTDQVAVPAKIELGSEPLYILAAPGVTLHVSGVVNGLVTVYSPKRIVIEGHLRYANRAPLEQGGDFLGLVSGLNVMVDKRQVVGEGDLQIDAAIYARSRFGVMGINGPRSGTLKLFGSLSVGTLTATQPRYATEIKFDQRLKNLRPPGFPSTNHYEIVAQNQHWQTDSSPYLDVEDDLVLEQEMHELTPQPLEIGVSD